MWRILCEATDVDMSREANAGRGPVDFKFSAGWRRRALIEVKLLSSSKLRQGAQAQLPQYLASEQVSCAYYMCVGFTDRDLHPERLAAVRDMCSRHQDRSGLLVIPRFIDARPKASASRSGEATPRKAFLDRPQPGSSVTAGEQELLGHPSHDTIHHRHPDGSVRAGRPVSGAQDRWSFHAGGSQMPVSC